MEIVNHYKSRSVNNTFQYYSCWFEIEHNKEPIREFFLTIQKNSTKKRRVRVRDIRDMISQVSTDSQWCVEGQLKIVIQKVNFDISPSGGAPGYWSDMAFLYAIRQKDTVKWYIYGYAKARYQYMKLDAPRFVNGMLKRRSNNVGYSVYKPGGQLLFAIQDENKL